MSAQDWRGYINLGQPALADVIRAAYDPSVPQGMGHLHFREGGLSDDEVEAILSRARGSIVASMDYVNGRAVKMTVRKDPDSGDLYIPASWYDHSRAALEGFLSRFGIAASAISEALKAQEQRDAEWKAENP
jgi:hypothetical protein